MGAEGGERHNLEKKREGKQQKKKKKKGGGREGGEQLPLQERKAEI